MHLTGAMPGADVSLITKTGSDAVHGTVFEFLRNEILKANDFFLNRTDQPRPVLKQVLHLASLGASKPLFFSFQLYRVVQNIPERDAGADTWLLSNRARESPCSPTP